MKFVVRRTSLWDDEVPPVKGAKLEDVLTVDARTFKSPEEHDARLGEKWASRGLNHRKVKGGIERDIPGKAWTYEISSLEELLAFGKEHGDLIVKVEDSLYGKGLGCIEIYDTYRE